MLRQKWASVEEYQHLTEITLVKKVWVGMGENSFVGLASRQMAMAVIVLRSPVMDYFLPPPPPSYVHIRFT